jgi:hypothetical protein
MPKDFLVKGSIVLGLLELTGGVMLAVICARSYREDRKSVG